MRWLKAAWLALLVLPAACKELSESPLREEIVQELPQAQDPDLINYDDYNPFGEDENGN